MEERAWPQVTASGVARRAWSGAGWSSTQFTPSYPRDEKPRFETVLYQRVLRLRRRLPRFSIMSPGCSPRMNYMARRGPLQLRLWRNAVAHDSTIHRLHGALGTVQILLLNVNDPRAWLELAPASRTVATQSQHCQCTRRYAIALTTHASEISKVTN